MLYQRKIFSVVVAILASSIPLFGEDLDSVDAISRRTTDGRRSLRFAQFNDPKTVTSRAKTTVTIYIAIDVFNESLSIFKTDILYRFGTGRVQYAIKENAGCSVECEVDAPGSQPQVPCLVVTRFFQGFSCDMDHLKCHYNGCKTMVMNDELCGVGTGFDSRMYYTSKRPDMGYLPLGPRVDSWLSFQKMQSSPNFSIAPSSKRKFAFNAIFSISTSFDRQALAAAIRQQGNTKGLPIYAAMARRWAADANDPKTKQINTDKYMEVLLNSIFTLAPAGHNPECFRLFEAVEAGSIPILTQDDLHGAHHPQPSKATRGVAHPCKDALHHWYDAPMVVLDSWEDLYPTVEILMKDPASLDKMQATLRSWYDGYMRKVVSDFEDMVLGSNPTAKN
ncbi:hypothetical protein ACHAWF_006556 [Thalassiosira exigua]